MVRTGYRFLPLIRNRGCAYFTGMTTRHQHMARASARTRSAAAARRATDLAPVIAAYRATGSTSLRTMAARLTEAGIAAPRASTWSATAVKRVLERIERGI